MRILTNPPLDYIIFIYSSCLQNLKMIKDQWPCHQLIVLLGSKTLGTNVLELQFLLCWQTMIKT